MEVPDARSGAHQRVETDWPGLWVHLGDDAHPWGGLPLLERLESMGVCGSGVLEGDPTGDVQAGFDLLDAERQCAAYQSLPEPGAVMDQPADVMLAFALLRAAMADQERREIDAIRQKGGM